MIKERLFEPNAPAFFIAASEVMTPFAAEITKGLGARKLGRQLLIDAMRKNNDWVKTHLKKIMFNSKSQKEQTKITLSNFNDIAYASTRMLHAWEKPAWINELPFIDGSYTCACPALELAELGYKKIIVISSEPGIPYNNIYQDIALTTETLSPSLSYLISPDYDLKTIGVDFTSASLEGMTQVYQHGYEKGLALANEFLFAVVTAQIL